MITDAVTQANVKVLGDGPALAMGAIYQSLAHSTGILYENAASAQQQLAIAAQAATNQGVIQIYSVDTMAGAVAAAKLAQSDVPDNDAVIAFHAARDHEYDPVLIGLFRTTPPVPTNRPKGARKGARLSANLSGCVRARPPIARRWCK